MNFNLFSKKIRITKNEIYKIINPSPLQYNSRLSAKYNSNIFIKREDLLKVRSFKIRGAFNKINNLDLESKLKGVVCASAGNHAQGVAYSCRKLKIEADIFIPELTPFQKESRIRYFGGDYCNVYKIGKNFNECLEAALNFCNKKNKAFIHPYNDIDTIIGQSTIALEIMEEIDPNIIIGSIGGGGMMSGISLFNKYLNKSNAILFGVEGYECDSMNQAFIKNKIVEIKIDDNFIDGASVSKVGDITFPICKENLNGIKIVKTGKVCETLLDIYQNDGIIAEPAGALSIAALDSFDKKELVGKNVVCILSGGNNDVSRYPEIMERSLIYQQLKHYYLVRFAQTPGQLKCFINNILGENDDICRFEYIKKTNKEFGDVLIGIQVSHPENIFKIDYHLKKNNFDYIKLNKDNSESALLYSYIV